MGVHNFWCVSILGVHNFWCVCFLVVSTFGVCQLLVCVFLVVSTFGVYQLLVCVFLVCSKHSFFGVIFGVCFCILKHQKRVFLDPPKNTKTESASFVVKKHPHTEFCGDFCPLENSVSEGHFTTKLALSKTPKKGKKGGSRAITLEKGVLF